MKQAMSRMLARLISLSLPKENLIDWDGAQRVTIGDFDIVGTADGQAVWISNNRTNESMTLPKHSADKLAAVLNQYWKETF